MKRHPPALHNRKGCTGTFHLQRKALPGTPPLDIQSCIPCEVKSVKAPEFPKSALWLNTDRPLSLDKLKGHVVLLDFWTYCCINCLHVLPDLAYLERKYRDEPFLVIGVHAAKFDNEQDPENIRQAIIRHDIEHPVVIDNRHEIWNSYLIRAWPTFVLIGADGHLIARGSGEGLRDELDRHIASALEEAKRRGILAPEKVQIRRPPLPDSTLSYPGKLAIHPKTGHLFVSDSHHHRILELKLSPENRAEVHRVIGRGKAGDRDGSYADAAFRFPQGMEVIGDKLYVCDTDNHKIREIDLSDQTVRTLAGNGKQALWPATESENPDVSLNSPWDLTAIRNHLYIAMAGSHQLWRLSLDPLRIEVFAGSGRENLIDGPPHTANLAQPSGIDAVGARLFFADSETSSLRTCNAETGEVATLIGRGLFDFGHRDGPFQEALLQHPLGVSAAGSSIYIADTYNHALRRADLNARKISTIIDRPRKSVCRIGDRDCEVLPLNEPNDVLWHDGKLFIADTNNHLIRVFNLQTEELKTLELA